MATSTMNTALISRVRKSDRAVFTQPTNEPDPCITAALQHRIVGLVLLDTLSGRAEWYRRYERI